MEIQILEIDDFLNEIDTEIRSIKNTRKNMNKFMKLSRAK